LFRWDVASGQARGVKWDLNKRKGLKRACVRGVRTNEASDTAKRPCRIKKKSEEGYNTGGHVIEEIDQKSSGENYQDRGEEQKRG